MRNLVTLVLLSLPFACVACVDQPRLAANSSDSSCVALLREIRALEQKVTWGSCEEAALEESPTSPDGDHSNTGPPPAPRIALDPAHCKLLNPNVRGMDKCLIDAISVDLEIVSSPICPRETEFLALGDLAFFVLSDRHPGLWAQVLPADIADAGLMSYTKWVSRPINRAALVKSIEQALWK